MINYRAAVKSDSPELAEFVDIASDGIVDYLFHDVVAGMTPFQVIASNLDSDHYPHTYKSAVVAADGNRLVGMVLSYPSIHHAITDEMRDFFPADRIAHLRDFYSSRVEDSWYIDTLCVTGYYRNQGIGGKLISVTKARALDNGYNALSLIVFAENTAAVRFYEKTGFEIVQDVKLPQNDFIKFKDGCLLMKCDVNT